MTQFYFMENNLCWYMYLSHCWTLKIYMVKVQHGHLC